MKIEWKSEAIEAAISRHYGDDWRGCSEKANAIAIQEMRETLDAAIKAQGDVYTREDMGAAVRLAKAQGRAEAFEEAAAFIEGKGGVITGVSAFARLLSRNNQPCMSGDARDRLNRLDRRAFDEATDALATAIRALASKG